MASPSGSSAATTAPNAISSTTSVIGKDNSSARCRSRSTVSLTALLMLASPVSAIRTWGWERRGGVDGGEHRDHAGGESPMLPVIRNWSSAAWRVAEIWLANLGSSGDWIWVARPVAWTRLSTSRIAAR